MFLTTPTLEELHRTELTDLVEMLVVQTNEYNKLFKKEGISEQSQAVKELILNIQAAIESKKNIHKPVEEW